jgi:hypothetical protein
MVTQNKNLRLFNRELTVEKEIMWAAQDDLQDIIWSNALVRFILITSTAIFTLDPEMMTHESLTLDQHRHINTWLFGTCSNHKLFLSTFDKGSSIVEYDLQPPIQFVREHTSPLSCAENESIDDLASNHAALALIISNDEHVMRLDLCSLITLERYWSFKFGLPSRNYTLSCCLLTNNEWMIIDQNDSELLHISKDGSFLKKYYCNSPLYAAVQFTDDSIAIVSEEGISLHRLV